MLRKTIFASMTVLAVATVMTVMPATSFAGRVGGPATIHGIATPDDYDSYTMRFEGGRVAHVTVKSMNCADLDIKIIDPVSLRVIAQDLRPARDGQVSFMPPRTREYIILIHNFSRDRGTRYSLHSN